MPRVSVFYSQSFREGVKFQHCLFCKNHPALIFSYQAGKSIVFHYSKSNLQGHPPTLELFCDGEFVLILLLCFLKMILFSQSLLINSSLICSNIMDNIMYFCKICLFQVLCAVGCFEFSKFSEYTIAATLPISHLDMLCLH